MKFRVFDNKQDKYIDPVNCSIRGDGTIRIKVSETESYLLNKQVPRFKIVFDLSDQDVTSDIFEVYGGKKYRKIDDDPEHDPCTVCVLKGTAECLTVGQGCISGNCHFVEVE